MYYFVRTFADNQIRFIKCLFSLMTVCYNVPSSYNNGVSLFPGFGGMPKFLLHCFYALLKTIRKSAFSPFVPVTTIL